jgi:hypothetical protein
MFNFADAQARREISALWSEIKSLKKQVGGKPERRHRKVSRTLVRCDVCGKFFKSGGIKLHHYKTHRNEPVSF